MALDAIPITIEIHASNSGWIEFRGLSSASEAPLTARFTQEIAADASAHKGLDEILRLDPARKEGPSWEDSRQPFLSVVVCLLAARAMGRSDIGIPALVESGVCSGTYPAVGQKLKKWFGDQSNDALVWKADGKSGRRPKAGASEELVARICMYHLVTPEFSPALLSGDDPVACALAWLRAHVPWLFPDKAINDKIATQDTASPPADRDAERDAAQFHEEPEVELSLIFDSHGLRAHDRLKPWVQEQRIVTQSHEALFRLFQGDGWFGLDETNIHDVPAMTSGCRCSALPKCFSLPRIAPTAPCFFSTSFCMRW